MHFTVSLRPTGLGTSAACLADRCRSASSGGRETDTAPLFSMPEVATSICYDLPEVKSRFAWQINPNYSEQMDRDANAWAISLFEGDPDVPVPRRIDNYTLWAPLCYPTVDICKLTLWCRFNALFTAVANRGDQVHGTERQEQSVDTWRRVSTALYQISHSPRFAWPDLGLPEYARQAVKITCDIASDMPTGTARYFLRCVAEMVYKHHLEDTVLATPLMDLEGYLDFRSSHFGIPLYVAAVRPLLAQDLRDEEWSDHRRAHMETLVFRHACLVNDLYSFSKECNDPHGKTPPVQSVTVLMHGHRLQLQEAIDYLVAVIGKTEESYVRLRDEFAESAPAQEYCTRLEHIIAGNLRYHLVSPRFHGADFTGAYTGGTARLLGAPLAPF